MKKIYLLLITLLVVTNTYSQTTCGTSVDNTFDVAGSLPDGWVEYNTSGRVTVEGGKLKFNHNTTMPSVYHTFSPTTTDSKFSFDVSASRASVNCQVHLISSTGKYLSSIAMGIGTATIKHATSITNGVPSAFTDGTKVVSFPTNTVFTVATQVKFDTKKIDLFINNELVATDVDFLEDAEDIAKIDIQLIFMYANNGQFYFDNISLLSGEENRLLLNTNVTAAENLIATASIGDNYNQYPQSAVDTFQSVVDDVNTLLVDCDASSSAIDSSISDLEAAQTVFEAARVNDPVLKLYANYDFTGEEREVFCGYYNGGLGAYDNFGVSFTLEKGYMVTFAENINGLGISKVYIAQDNDLAINLPENLQNKISFIRLSPWFNVQKKGIGAKGTDVVATLDNKWWYNWGNNGIDVDGAKFVPNQWGGGSVTTAINLGKRMDIDHYMAYNEPDNDDQSNMTVDRAIEKYPELLASGLRLGSPANTDGAKGEAWRNEFMTKAEAAGLRVDYIVVHYYKKTSPANFYNWLKAIHDKWKRPIWIKEFNYGATWTAQPASNTAAGNGLISYMNMLDNTDFVERYAVFTWQPDKPIYSLMSVRTPVTLSSSGIMYRDHVSPAAYTQETYEQGGNLSVEDDLFLSTISVFPTLVTNGVLNVRYSDDIQKDTQVTMFNIMGQQVKKVSLSKQISVGNLAPGLYLLKITSGSKSIDKKIIIQ
ncbi:glycosyl hydrolase [uncultured Polaribacter sp.]|uniref:glycosyl hydrolase n=1 Tax=uncultured Polaribacter sp. TaxID=174711 RepID=UPI0026239D62|nr:glycosyl hydrolase [uncultured Polaribacter sp.]